MVSELKQVSKSIHGIDEFNGAVCHSFCPMTCESTGEIKPSLFNAQLSKNVLDRIQVAQISSGAVKVNRTKEHIARVCGDAFYLVKFQLQGESIVHQRGRQAHLKVGDFVICSTSEPYRLNFPSNYSQAVLSLPQPMLKSLFHSPDDFLGIRMDCQFPIHGILSQFMFSLIPRMELLDAEVIKRLEANILDLLITSLRAQEGVSRKPQDSCAAMHLHRIKRYIGMHLKDPELSPDVIAQAANISKRYLHKLFKEEGISISNYVKRLRLDCCRRALSDPALSHITTTEIALENGFGDISHFHRCFKTEYKITPRQMRIQLIR